MVAAMVVVARINQRNLSNLKINYKLNKVLGLLVKILMQFKLEISLVHQIEL